MQYDDVRMPKDLLSALLFAAAVCGVLIMEGEIATRIFRLASEKMIEQDSCTGFKPIPGKSGYISGPAGSMFVVNNNEGFRDVEHEIEKPAGTRRVLILGDSTTEATQVPLEETYWRVMQRHADMAGAPVEFISLAVSSFGTDQELKSYECYGRRYDPDIVLLGFFAGNDLFDNHVRKDPFTPQYSLIEGELILDESYRERIAERAADRASWFPGVLYWIKDNSSFARLIYEKLSSSLTPAFPGLSPYEVNPLYRIDQNKQWEDAWLLTEALIGRLDEMIRMDGGRLIIIEIPTLEQMDPQTITEPERYDLRQPSERLAGAASRLRIPLIDLYPALRDAQMKAPVHWRDDPHWNRFGHEVAALEILKRLSAMQLSPFTALMR